MSLFLKYTVDGVTKVYEIRPGKVGRKRAAMAERAYSKAVGERRTWAQLQADAQQGSMEAWAALLWVAQTADHPGLRYEDLPDFDTEQLVMEHSAEEIRQMRAGLAASKTMLESERDAIIAQLDIALETAPVGSDEPAAKPDLTVLEPVDAEGKDQPTTGEALTS
jgi:hypothetical protein